MPLLAPTPPLGWNSFDSYATQLHEEAAKANLEAMAEKLRPSGYEYFVIDSGWFGEFRLIPGTLYTKEKHASDVRLNEYGLFQPSKTYFPGGLQPIIDRCHDLGMKFGIHQMRGVPRKAVELNLPIEGTKHRASEIANTDPEENCRWCDYCYAIDMDKPGAQEYYNSVLRQLASWGVDFLKYDDIATHPREIDAVAEAVSQCGRPMVLSLSPGGRANPDYLDSYQKAQMLRITHDIWDNQKGIDSCFEAWRKWHGKARPGFWMDMDMIPFGQLRLMTPPMENSESTDEQTAALVGEGQRRWCRLSRAQKETFMALRALSASPLMMGGDLPTLDDESLALITNPEMLACDQNGVMGELVDERGRLETWQTRKRASSDEGWVGVFNRGETPVSVDLGTEKLGFGTPGPMRCVDVWTGKQFVVGPDRQEKCEIAANGVLFLACRPAD